MPVNAGLLAGQAQQFVIQIQRGMHMHKKKTAPIHEALRELVARAAARRLAALGGTMPRFNFKAGRRRRPTR